MSHHPTPTSSHTARDVSGEQIAVSGNWAPHGQGYILLTDDTTAHTLTIGQARALTVGMLLALADAEGDER